MAIIKSEIFSAVSKVNRKALNAVPVAGYKKVTQYLEMLTKDKGISTRCKEISSVCKETSIG